MAAPGLGRRQVLGLGGGAAAAVALGANPAAHAAGRGTTAHAAPRRPSALPVSPAFDLGAPWGALVAEKPLWCPTVMRAFGLDHLNDRLYTVQVTHHPGDGVPHARRLREGDVAVTELSADGGTRLGRMYLRGFGHGAQFGVEPTAPGSAPYLWIAYDSRPNRAGVGVGTRLCRIRYAGRPADAAPRAFHWDDPADRAAMEFLDRTPVASALPGAGGAPSGPRPSVDPHHRRLLVCFRRDGRPQCAVYDLADAVRADLGRPLAHRADLPRPAAARGFALYGSYLYLYEGTAYTGGGPEDPGDAGSAHLTRLDLVTGATTRAPTRAFPWLTHREPRGVGVGLVPASFGHRPLLCFGFASGEPGERTASIAYQDALV